MHQYYESRIAADGNSAVDGQPFRQLSRADFSAPAGPRWYVCMQKPFKFTPAFDRMLAAVHARDPEGVILLHEIQARYAMPHVHVHVHVEWHVEWHVHVHVWHVGM